MTASPATIWTVILVLGVCTFLIRFSFLGMIGDRNLPVWIQRALRYTPVAVMPGLVAPLILWPAATGGAPDPARLAAAVATVGLGMCASMGQFLLSSGTKGKRYLTSHARVLMHQPSGGIGGTATDVRINAELIMDMKKTMSELTAEQTGHTLEEIYRDNEYDHWFTAQEALDYGFVDKLVTTPDTIGNNQQGE